VPFAHDNPTPPDEDRYIAHNVETEVFRNPDMPKGDHTIGDANGVVTVRGTVRDHALMQKVLDKIEKDTKTHQDRYLAIDPVTCAMIREHLDGVRAELATVSDRLATLSDDPPDPPPDRS